MTRFRAARAGLIAGVIAWSAVFAALAATARDTVPAVINGTAGPDEGLAALAAVLGLAVLGWLALIVVITALTQLLPRGGRASLAVQRLDRVITPAAARRLLAVAVAGALVSGAAPAQAATTTSAAATTPAAAAFVTATGSAATGPGPLDRDRLDPGWSDNGPAAPGSPTPQSAAAGSPDPGWPTATQGPGPRSTGAGRSPAPTTREVIPAAASRATATALDPSWGPPTRHRSGAYPEQDVVVRHGDTLWDIASRHLGPAATDAEIAQAWPHWFTANREAIGPDPDHLRPGQRLHPPGQPAGGIP